MRKRKASEPKTPLKQTKISSFFTKADGSNKRFCPGKENSPKNVESPDIIICTPPAKTAVRARKSLLQDLSHNGVNCNKSALNVPFEKGNAECGNEEKKEERGVFNEISQINTTTPTKNFGIEGILEGTVEVICTPDVIFCTPPEKTLGKARKSLMDYFVKNGDGNSGENAKKNLFEEQTGEDEKGIPKVVQNSSEMGEKDPPSELFTDELSAFFSNGNEGNGCAVDHANKNHSEELNEGGTDENGIPEVSQIEKTCSGVNGKDSSSELFTDELNIAFANGKNGNGCVVEYAVENRFDQINGGSEDVKGIPGISKFEKDCSGVDKNDSSELFTDKFNIAFANDKISQDTSRHAEEIDVGEIDSSFFEKPSSEGIETVQPNFRTSDAAVDVGRSSNVEMVSYSYDKSPDHKFELTVQPSIGKRSLFKNVNSAAVLAKNLGENITEESDNLLCSDVDSAFSEMPLSERFCDDLKITSPKKPPQDTNADAVFAHYDDFGIDDFGENWSSQNSCQDDLDFDPCVVCEVMSTVSSLGSKFEQLLTVKAKDSGKKGRCVLRDMWAVNISFSIGDTLTILACYQGGDWVVDAQKGYVCLFPEILVSSTSLVGAMFCRRRGVLSNYFKGIDSENRIMTIGSLVHEMLQKSLDVPSCTGDDLENIVNSLLADIKILRSLYSCGMTVEEIKIELRFYIPFIINFLKVYVTREEVPVGKNFRGAITKIVDIEENVFCSKLGIKGRIDVTVNVKINGKNKKMPLELKTGRASFSQEHRSQVFLYTIMMSSIGEKIESGLLLYLKEGILEEVKPSHVEIRDLILLRNDFAQYLRRFDVSSLPEPIHFLNACRKCPYSTICTAYLSESVPEKHPIRSLGISFDTNHLAYFQKWTELLLLEDSYCSNDADDFKLTGLTLDEGVVRLKSGFKYTFIRNATETSLKAGNYVIITADTLNYSGRIISITLKSCSVLLEKELLNMNGTYEVKGFKISMLSKYLTNLGEFMEEPYHNLREIIINKQLAKINDKFPKSMLSGDSLKILGQLNEDQQRAVLKVLAAEDYILIEGPPGTGKTQTIVAMLRIFVAMKFSVLLVGHTHSSVDNVLLRVPDIDYVRLGSLSNIHESVQPKSYSELSKTAKSVFDIEALLKRRVVASTCLGLDADIVRKIKFDVCIVDESSQVLQPEVLKPLFCSKKFILIGDPKQLRPVVRNPMAKNVGMDESIFERLFNDSSSVSLTIQYRMNKIIMGLANSLTYGNKLRVGSELVAGRRMKLTSSNVDEEWLKMILSTKLEDSIVFVNTANYLAVKPGQSFSCENPVEAKLTVKIVETLIACGLEPEAIGVMAPFRAHVQKLSESVPQGIEVNTVDQYQGRDKDVIVFSCCKMDRYDTEKSENELLNDERRFTVSVTRGKSKLIFIGDKETLVKYKTFERLFDYLNNCNVLPLKEGALGFTWAPFEA